MKNYSMYITALLVWHSIGLGLQNTWEIAPRKTLVIQQGDITKCSAEAIVNAANAQLQGGSGVCGAVFQAAGWEQLQEACNEYPMDLTGDRCPVGYARITKSFGLESRGVKYIIHSVGPDCRIVRDESEQNRLLWEVYNNTLRLALEHTLQTIAFPFISTGIYGFPKERAAELACGSVKTFLRFLAIAEPEKALSVIFVVPAVEDYVLFETTMHRLIASDMA